MSEVKWIKIVTDIFDDEKILLIESMPDSDALIVIWFKLLCLAGKQNNNGVFLLSGRIAYTDEMFATIFRRPLNTVRLALKTFENLGMIEIVNNTVTIPNWGKHQQLDALEASREATRKRVERYREKQKCLIGSMICQYCGAQATGYDHIIALARGGSDTEDNKVECCIECNRIKNDKPLIDFLNGNRERINDELVMSNPKLTKYVTLSNVTGRYNVTFGNADRIDKNRVEKKREEKKRKEDTTSLRDDDVRRICEMLNDRAGTHYKPGTAATQKHINARLAEGFTVDDFQTVIDKKCAEWMGTDMEKYLRPETLFGSKFESYLNAPATRAKKSSNPFEDMIREQEERMRAVEVEAEVIP